MRSIYKRQAGMTLVEVMVASAILAIFLASFIYAYLNAIHSHYTAGNYFRASCIARDRVQRARSLAFSTLPLLAEASMAVDADGNASLQGTYRRTTLIITNAVPGAIQLTVQVFYPDVNGTLIARPVEMTTLFSDKM